MSKGNRTYYILTVKVATIVGPRTKFLAASYSSGCGWTEVGSYAYAFRFSTIEDAKARKAEVLRERDWYDPSQIQIRELHETVELGKVV